MELLIGHLLGDYVFQNDWMALNKTKMTLKGWIACWSHSLVYICCVGFVTGWFFTAPGRWALTITFVAHYVQDKTRFWVTTWMNLMGSFIYFRETVNYAKFNKVKMPDSDMFILNEAGVDTRPRDFWPTIIIDNTFHLLQLWLVQKFIIGV